MQLLLQSEVWSGYFIVALSALLPSGANPSCLQATLASKVDQKPSQMVPQVSFQQSSTRPSSSVFPPASLRSPLPQRTKDENFYEAHI